VAVERRILEKAPAVLARGGQPTVAEFARAAGTSRASFYRHFKSREALLEALEVAPEPGARDRILAAAADLIGASGIGALVMDEIADRSGVSRATVYRLFPGKPALVLALVHAYSPFDQVAELLASRSTDPPEVLLPEIARSAYRATAGHAGLIRMLFFEVSGLSPETEEVARQTIANVVGMLVMYLVAQMDAGRLRRAHPFLALQSFIGPILFHILTRQVAEKILALDVDGETSVTQLAETWLRAMAAPPKSREEGI
jgi:AcrR family transcriptional regulator